LLTLGGGVRWFRDGLVVALLVFFAPFFAPLGEAVYNWVARNRYRIPTKERCQIG
jgi:predicted DCC family thiol-disulfide oxidoreductase YuxK